MGIQGKMGGVEVEIVLEEGAQQATVAADKRLRATPEDAVMDQHQIGVPLQCGLQAGLMRVDQPDDFGDLRAPFDL